MSDKRTQVILVDPGDNELGPCEKLEAHEKGLLHRAFSIFIFNGKGQLMLQKRARNKYHSGGLWTNTCCSHPAPGEATPDAAHARLWEEMGLKCTLKFAFAFTYNAAMSNGLMEHELDHVFMGHTDEPPTINPAEAEDWKYIGLEELQSDLDHQPEKYSQWLRICWPLVVEKLRK